MYKIESSEESWSINHDILDEKRRYSQFLFNSQHTSVIDMKRMKMMRRNLQDDDHHSRNK